MNCLRAFLASSIVCLVLSGNVWAAPIFGFEGISNNSAVDTLIGESQFSVELFDIGSSQVKFVFSNSGPFASSIANLYWGDSAGLLTPACIINSSGVLFNWGAAPPDMQGGVAWSATIASDADNPKPTKGINPGESAGFLFDIRSGSSFADIVSGIETSSLNVGLHAIAFLDGNSEWFEVGGNPPVVPTPAASLLGLVGAGLVGLFKRRISR